MQPSHVVPSMTMITKSQFSSIDVTYNSVNEMKAAFAGSYGNHATMSGESDGFNQDFVGGGNVFVADDKITMLGNSWKAFELSDPYPVTKDTRLRFNYEVTEEAEGHAICLDGDLNEMTFGGDEVRCIMIAEAKNSKNGIMLRK